MAAKTQFGDEADESTSSAGTGGGGKTMFGDSADAADFSGAYPTQPDHKDEGFIAHATKTIRDLPDAFLSGRMISAPLESLRDSMGSYIQNPTLHNGIRAIPGVAMAEDAIMQPYRTAQGGDIAGAFGDAADIAAQLLGVRAAGIRPAEPLRAVQVPGESATLPKMNPFVRMLTNKIPIAGHMLTGAYDVAQERGMSIPGRTQTRIYGPPMDVSTSEGPTAIPPSGTFGIGPQSGFGPSPKSVPPPVEVGGAHIPKPAYVHPLPQPGEETQLFRSAPIYNSKPSGSFGGGPQAGFSGAPRPRFYDPVDTNALPLRRTAPPIAGEAGAPWASPIEGAVIPEPLVAPSSIPNGKTTDYSGITSQYRPSRTKARFDASGKRIGG